MLEAWWKYALYHIDALFEAWRLQNLNWLRMRTGNLLEKVGDPQLNTRMLCYFEIYSFKLCDILDLDIQKINTLRPRRKRRHFADDIFKCIFLNENVWLSIKISLKFVPKSPINNIIALVQIMAWCRPGDKTLSEPVITDAYMRHPAFIATQFSGTCS